ncbi:MAG: hypothetical protein R3324_16040 [Halobacteriales archaeon]|nr:hypothetical protein [Halobacteriales archaeon]
MVHRSLHAVLLVGLVSLTVVAGCTSPAQPAGSPSPAPPTDRPTDTPTTVPTVDPSTRSPTPAPPVYRPATTTPVPLTEPVDCSDDLFVSFWGLSDRHWRSDEVRFGAYLPPNASYVFVAYVDGSVAGTEPSPGLEGGDGLNVDGQGIRLDGPLAGIHTVRIVAYRDSNRNGVFDPGTDRPCSNDDGLVQTSHYAIDFSRFSEEG